LRLRYDKKGKEKKACLLDYYYCDVVINFLNILNYFLPT
jgi:hypothetical protein